MAASSLSVALLVLVIAFIVAVGNTISGRDPGVRFGSWLRTITVGFAIYGVAAALFHF